MQKNHTQVVAGLLGLLGVGLGAFGAHGLRDILTERQMIEVWQTAVFYHLIHAVVLLGLSQRGAKLGGRESCFLIGIFLFSGSLYGMALIGWRGLGAVTPVGGVFLLLGWAGLIYEGCKGKGATYGR